MNRKTLEPTEGKTEIDKAQALSIAAAQSALQDALKTHRVSIEEFAHDANLNHTTVRRIWRGEPFTYRQSTYRKLYGHIDKLDGERTSRLIAQMEATKGMPKWA